MPGCEVSREKEAAPPARSAGLPGSGASPPPQRDSTWSLGTCSLGGSGVTALGAPQAGAAPRAGTPLLPRGPGDTATLGLGWAGPGAALPGWAGPVPSSKGPWGPRAATPRACRLTPLRCRHPRCWSGCCPGGGCRVASRAGWRGAPGAAASCWGEPARARASTAGSAGPAGEGRGQLEGWGLGAGDRVSRLRPPPAHLPQGPRSAQGLRCRAPQGAPGPRPPQHGQGQQGLGGGPQLGVRLQHHDQDGT